MKYKPKFKEPKETKDLNAFNGINEYTQGMDKIIKNL